MCAVVTVGAVVGPTCGACAARAWRWSTAYRRVPKRCAPKSWGLFSTKIINRAIFACFAPRKQVRVCKFHSFGGIFCFLLYTRAQKRASHTALTRGTAPQVGELERQAGGGGSILNAFLRMIHKNIASCAQRAVFPCMPSRQRAAFCPPRHEPAQKNGQTADGHTGCRSAVWPLLDKDRHTVSAHCGARQCHRA